MEERRSPLVRLLLLLLLLPLFPVFFTVAAGGGDPSDGDGDGDGDNGGNGNGDDDGDGDSDDGDDDGDKKKGKTYTQTQMDAIIRKRLARQQKKLDKLDEFEASHKELQTLKKAEMTETERLRTEAADLKKKLEDGEDGLVAKAEMLQERLIRLEVRTQAVKLGFIDPDDAYLLADLSGVSVDEDTDKVTGVEKTLKALAKSKPHLVESGDGGPGTPPRSAKKAKSGKAKVPKPKVRL